ncbi:MAG: GNAT family N-acetyltransferase [Candidatus Onthomonas sp.]
MAVRLSSPEAARSLFFGWEDTMIWAALEGTMGAVWADREEYPGSALILNGDFAFFAGRPDRSVLTARPAGWKQDFLILTPQNEDWSALIEAVYGPQVSRRERYATRKEGDVFDRALLRRQTERLPAGCRLRPIDESLYRLCMAEPWSRDLVSRFPTWVAYQSLALGWAVTRGAELLSGASTYSRYSGGIEIEIDTRPDCRRQGLASACGAALILDSLERGLYPSWDAQNRGSLALAERLGYRFSHAYPVYELSECALG